MPTATEMQKLFELVQNEEHWKNPIDAWVPKETDMDALNEAVIYYTGSSILVGETNDLGMTHITADGYFLTIGA
jgi:hypothetical protein